uniref:Uncharacterized protein n=1 Tax=Rhizophora mucronata TaxID=61149 RepID=A0A2P2QNM3_RHIMU
MKSYVFWYMPEVTNVMRKNTTIRNKSPKEKILSWQK